MGGNKFLWVAGLIFSVDFSLRLLRTSQLLQTSYLRPCPQAVMKKKFRKQILDVQKQLLRGLKYSWQHSTNSSDKASFKQHI